MSIERALESLLAGLVDAQSVLPYKGDWLPEEHAERLRQYEIFRALYENRFGALLKDRDAAKKFRQYGDYALIVDTSRDAVLGDQVSIDVPGSDDDANAGAAARQKLLDAWAERERWASKLYRGETDAAAVGDCVYELRPDGTRLRLRVHDPESFFPVWQSQEGDFDEAYLAWEEPNNGQYLEGDVGNLRDLRNRDGEVVLYRRHYRKLEAAAARAAGLEVLTGAGQRDVVCVVTAGWYRIETRGGDEATGFDHLQLLAHERTRDDDREIVNLDTGFDEIPLWYVPNVEQTRQPWGEPEGSHILYALLDAAQDQVDLKENTYMNAFPVMYDENPPTAANARPGQPGTPAEQKYKPGVIYNGRRLGAVDLSKGNALLLEHEKWLIDKALMNSRTTQIAAGRLEPGDIPSGVALLIALLPLLAKTMPKRVTRTDKLGMLLKHVLRWHRDWADPAQFFGEDGEVSAESGEASSGWPAGIWDDFKAYPSFGSIIPIDKTQVSEMVSSLLSAGAISEETAVTMLMAAGFPIDDAAEEVKRLREASAAVAGTPGSGLGGVIPGLEEDDEG